MNNFKLSRKSLKELNTCHPALIKCVKFAIKVTSVDFFVHDGLRTPKEQAAFIKAKKSQKKDSKHLTGRAVDLVAIVGGKTCWEITVYDDIANAMREAAKFYNVKMRWGGAWTCNSIKDWKGKMWKAYLQYIDIRRSQGRTPFADGPHFELMK